jgi:hypothetical protein
VDEIPCYTQDGTVNDNIVKQVKGRSYLQVVVGGKVVERSTELAYRTMIDNNDKLIASKAAPEIKPRDVMKPLHLARRRRLHPNKTTSSERGSSGLGSRQTRAKDVPTKKPFLTVPSSTDIHAEPDLDLAV